MAMRAEVAFSVEKSKAATSTTSPSTMATSLALLSRGTSRDIVEKTERMKEVYLKIRQEAEDDADIERLEELQDRLHDLADERAGFVEELSNLGVELKDPNIGLVDFPARLEDRVVYLCWRLGEESIDHWHELTSGFSGREPVEGCFGADPVVNSSEA